MQSQTKCYISTTKRVISLRLERGLELINHAPNSSFRNRGFSQIRSCTEECIERTHIHSLCDIFFGDFLTCAHDKAKEQST